MIEVEIGDPAWTTAVPEAETLAIIAAKKTLARAQSSKNADLAILLTDDESVRRLNAQFREIDRPTNVLSFPAAANPEGHMGDIALAFGVCDREARAQGKALANHLRHLVAHGVLHLLGYDHRTDAEAEAMEALERRVLAGLGVADPYAIKRGADADHV